ncbi:MAG: hypothetical protein NW703_09555 [Nitrospiraceae bacterium]
MNQEPSLRYPAPIRQWLCDGSVRVIVDVNIIVSGLLSPAGPAGKILDAVLRAFSSLL